MAVVRSWAPCIIYLWNLQPLSLTPVVQKQQRDNNVYYSHEEKEHCMESWKQHYQEFLHQVFDISCSFSCLFSTGCQFYQCWKKVFTLFHVLKCFLKTQNFYLHRHNWFQILKELLIYVTQMHLKLVLVSYRRDSYWSERSPTASYPLSYGCGRRSRLHYSRLSCRGGCPSQHDGILCVTEYVKSTLRSIK